MGDTSLHNEAEARQAPLYQYQNQGGLSIQ